MSGSPTPATSPPFLLGPSPLPSLVCAPVLPRPLHFYLFIFIWSPLAQSLARSVPFPPPAGPRSLPPSGSLLSPRSGASGAPPLARRDVARGDVDAAVSGALDVCALPGPGLQGRRRPLRSLLEQQQPQVRRWGTESRGYPGSEPCGRSGGGGDRRAPAAGRAHPGACLTRAQLAWSRPWEAHPSRPSLLSKPPRKGRVPLGVPEAARSRCLLGRREIRKRAGAEELGLRHFPARAGWPAGGISIQVPGLGAGSPGSAPPQLPPGACVRLGCGENPPNIPKVFFFFLCVCVRMCVCFNFYPVFSRCAQRAHGLGEVRGAGKRKL